VAVVETAGCAAVCFDAPVVELLETRALGQHPSLARLGPDLLATAPDLATAVARLRAPERASLTIAEALLDQTAVAGLGNVYRSELLFMARIDPSARAASLDPAVLEPLLMMGVRLLGANTGGGERATMPDALGAQPWASAGLRGPTGRWVYRRAGRPCRRCGTPIRSSSLGQPPRRLYWCPTCQIAP
jgi:endonuclease-8